MNCHVNEENIEGMIEMLEGRGRIRQRILVDFRKMRRYSKFKEETLDRTL